MIELKALGGLRLLGPSGSDCDSVLAQPKRLALLAYLALAHRGEHARRDTILALFWPELDDEHARGALRQSVRFLRRALGDGVLVAHGSGDIGVDDGALWCDAVAFDRAFDAGQLSAAADLYRGDLLQGLFVSDAAPSLEQWIENERARLRRRGSKALWHVVDDCDAGGNGELAAEHARRALGLFPDDEAGLRRLITLLHRLGDRDGAVRAYRAFARHLESEYEVAPAAATTALMAAARSRPHPESASSDATDVASGDPVRAEPAPAPTAPAAPVRTPSPAIPTPNPVRATLSRRAGRAMLPLAAGVGLAVVAVAALTSSHRAPAALDSNLIAIVPWRVSGGDSSLAYLSEGMADLVGATLTGEGGPRAIDPRTTLSAWRRLVSPGSNEVREADAFRLARSVGAGQVLLGEVVRASDSHLVLNGTVLSVADRKSRAHARIGGRVDSLTALIDRLAGALLAQRAGENEHQLTALSKTSLPALRAYLDGRSAYRRGQYAAAIAHFTRALNMDSAFALGGLALASAAGFSFKLRPGDQAVGDEGWWSEADSAWRRGAEIAWRNQSQLSMREQAYLEALRGTRYPSGTPVLEQLANWESAVHTAPDLADAWYRFGLILLYQGPSVDVRDSHARAATAFRRALALDSGFVAPLAGLLEIAAFARDVAEVRRLGALYQARDSLGEIADYVRWRVATTVGDSAALRSLRARIQGLTTETLGRIQWTSQVDGIALDDAERALNELLRRAGSRVERARVLGQARMLALNRGRPSEALRLDDSMLDLQGQPYWNPGFRVVYALHWDADTGAAAATARNIERTATATLASGNLAHSVRARSTSHLFIAAQWRLRHGDTVTAARTVDLLRRFASDAAARFADVRRADLHRADVLDALLAAVTRRQDAAAMMKHLDSLTVRGCCETPHYANLIVARLLEQSGDAPGALRAIRRGRWYFPPEELSSYLREEGRLAALSGDRQGAIRAYRHYLVLRSNPEPAMKAQVDRLRAELARLERQR